MSRRKLIFAILAMTLSAFLLPANAQMSEEAAREQARGTVLSELRSTLNVKPDQFLGVQRDQELEQSLAVATVGWRAGPVFIYRIRETGIEVRENAVINHLSMDADFMYIVAVRSADGSTYRIHGFGLADSLAEFQKLVAAAKMRVASTEQAESLADFCRKVNPKNYEDLTPISSLIELKQAAERQCQTGSFDADEKAFKAWWKRAKPLYANVSFRETARASNGGYLVEWVVLSSAAKGNCGVALRARLQVSSDGHVGEPTFSQHPEAASGPVPRH